MSSTTDTVSSKVLRRRGPRPRTALSAAFAVVFAMMAVRVVGADPAPAEPETTGEIRPLALKEEMIRDRFERFQDRVYRLRESLSAQEPQNAAKLARVLQRAGELGLLDDLNQLVETLQRPEAMNQALDAQAAWLADADRLLAILLERDGANEERQDEIDRLEQYHQRVGEILKQERAIRNATGQDALGQRMGAQLDQAIQRVNALLKRQDALSAQARAQAGGGDKPSDSTSGQLGDKQDALAQDTKQLAEDLERLAKLGGDDADKPTSEAAKQKTAEAAKSTQDSAGAMSEAGKKLGGGQSGAAGSKQQQAKASLEKAREQLEDAKRALEETPASQELAEKQKDVAEQTGDLSKQMQTEADASGGQPGSPSGSSSPPGQQNLNQAQQDMNKAAQSLGKSKTNDAAKSEDQAIDQLEQARKELEKALAQKRQEQREEVLRDMEARFREMLNKQRGINDGTDQMAERGATTFGRAEHLELAELSTKEQTLAGDADACLHILEEDGTTIVFPRVLQQLSEDMRTVATRLAAYHVGTLTRTIEAEIVDTLEQLLEAIQQMQQENEQQGQMQMDSESGPSPLLPESAELKLLRASQLRVNTRTAAIESAQADERKPDDSLVDALKTVAARQRECAKIAEEMRERQQP